ncbi:MAG TPA: acylneuraminate cytidylyltransferase family protein [Gemmatimonadaceae bacterium]|nr:acylneuraminate cytidylyltransferase family protein [Gemmatimonadaceae bacterium]
MTEVLGLVTARGGSKRLPRKALADLGGRPLIDWTIAAARNSTTISRIVASTDDAEIAHAARRSGAEVPFLRPPQLASDHAAHILTVEHTLDWLHVDHAYAPDYVVLLQPTSPFRSAEDIDDAVRIATTNAVDAVIGVCLASDHPHLAKKIERDGTLSDFFEGPRPAYVRRQDLEPAYVVNGAIYVNRRVSLLETRSFVPHGATAYLMPRNRSVDIDTEWDLAIARLVAENAARD